MILFNLKHFLFHPTVHDFSFNFSTFSKLSIFNNFSILAIFSRTFLRFCFSKSSQRISVHVEKQIILSEIGQFRAKRPKPSCEILICQVVKSDVSALESSSSKISRNDNLDIRDSVPLKFVSHRAPSKKLPTEKIFWWSMMLGIGKTTLKSLQALHSALLHSISRFFLARRVILES